MNITRERAEEVHLYSDLEKYQRSITEVLGESTENAVCLQHLAVLRLLQV